MTTSDNDAGIAGLSEIAGHIQVTVMDSPSQKPWLTLNRSQVLNARITQLQSTGAASQSVASVVEDLNDYYERGTLQIAPTQNFNMFLVCLGLGSCDCAQVFNFGRCELGLSKRRRRN